MKLTRRTAIGAAIVVFAVGAAVAYVRSSSVISVDVFEARKGPIEEIVTAVSAGTVKSRWESVLSAETLGRVAEVRVQEGAHVQAGDVIGLADSEAATTYNATHATTHTSTLHIL